MLAMVLAAALECAAPRASLAQNAQQPPTPQQPMTLSASRGFGTPAVVLQNAPIMLLPDSTRLPLRIAQSGSQLRVIQQSGEWSTVQFQDPDFGLRTGYVQSRFLRLQPADAGDPGSQPPAAPPPESQSVPLALSESAGFFAGGGFEVASISPNDVVLGSKSHSGPGVGFVAGYGVSRLLSIYGAFSTAGINGDTAATDYSVKHYDVGARIHFSGPARRTVPFLQGAFSWRDIKQDYLVTSIAHTLEASGPGASFGGGVNVHVVPALAVSASAVWTVGQFTSYQIDHVETVVDAGNTTSVRVQFGVVWFPKAGR